METDYSKVTAQQSRIFKGMIIPDGAIALYNGGLFGSGYIILGRESVCGDFSETGSIIKTLNHENMHKVLEESMLEERASWDYDDAFGDYPIHSIDDEYLEAINENDWRKIT